jgi:hypothetical protein
MRPVRWTEIKRDAWKRKAAQRATQLRESRKEIRRLKEVISRLKETPQSEEKPSQSSSQSTTVSTLTPESLEESTSNEFVNKTRSLSVLFVIAGVQPFRSIPRALALV